MARPCRHGRCPRLTAHPGPGPRGPQSPAEWPLLGRPLAQPAQDLLMEMAEDGGRLGEPELGRGRKPVLLEKTNFLGSETAAGSGGLDVAAPSKLRLPRRARWEQRQSAFTEVQRLRERLGGRQTPEQEHGDPAVQPGPRRLTQDTPWDPAGSMVFSRWPSGARSEHRSAFSKPAKCPAETLGPAPVFPASEPVASLGHLSRLASTRGIPCWSRLSNSKRWVGGFWHLQMWPQNVPLSSTFLGGPTLWLKHTIAETPAPASPAPTSSPTPLPPTLASPGLSPQNCCAVCNLCFPRTCDLVFHMRSRHKKEPAGPEPRSARRPEETLACPVCHEHFREHHHLSRHMASHS